jgi:alpha-N-arabinofuranosidase
MYKNPIIPGFHPDPSICRVGGDYYLVTSTFEYFPGVPIFHSRDLVHWKKIGHCLTRASQLELAKAKSSQGIFAPTLRHKDGRFYLITTNVSSGGNFYVTTSDPSTEWSEPHWIQESGFGMDPSLFFDDDGKVYYTRHGGGERGAIFQAELDLASATLRGEARPIWAGTGGIWPEGPHLYKIAGTYYLLSAEGGTSYGHAQVVARSSSAWGPFEACPHNPILTHRDRLGHPIQATGHADLVQAENGSWWLVFLGIRPLDSHHHLGRETFLAPVSWEAGWPVVHGAHGVELEMDGAHLPPAHAWPAPAPRDEFETSALGLDYLFVRNPEPDSYSLTARPGWLRLRGNATTLDSVGSPAFVGRRQQHFDCRAAALLEFEPSTSQAEAGLTLRANEENHYDLFVHGVGAERRLTLRARRLGLSEIVAETPLASGAVELWIRATAEHYEFGYAANGHSQRLGTLPTRALSTESAGGFTGVCIGLFACSKANPAEPADFDWFEYAPGRGAE